jgi:integrase
LTPENIDLTRRVAHLAMTKNGTSRDVPLSPRALALLERLGERVFDLSAASLDALWRKAKGRTPVQDLHFHDLRAEALTRLSRVFSVLELARISGHKDLNLLMRVYYREDAADLAARMGR